MDELNQIQNPNMTPPVGGPGQVMGPTPPPATGIVPTPSKGKSMMLWVIVAIACVAAGVAWWYISQMSVEPVVQQQPAINQEAREDMKINQEIQNTDSANLDAEFKSIDNDINSL